MKKISLVLLIFLLPLFLFSQDRSAPESDAKTTKTEEQESKPESKEEKKALPKIVRPEDEAPPYFMDIDQNSTEVKLKIKGFWEMEIKGGTGFAFQDRNFSFPRSLGDFTEGFLFTQHPDLEIFLLLKKHFFFEAEIGQELTESSLMTGYLGDKEDFIQKIQLGNAQHKVPDYPFITVPDADFNAPGLSAFFKSPISKHEVLVRYDPSRLREKFFYGNQESITFRTALGEFLRGRFFILPDQKIDLESLQVFSEDNDGPYQDAEGRKYRLLKNSEINFNSLSGELALLEEQPGRILVYYEKNGFSVGNDSLGASSLAYLDNQGRLDFTAAASDFSWSNSYGSQPMTDWQVEIAGKNCLLLYSPGLFLPFEAMGFYQLPAGISQDNEDVLIGLANDDQNIPQSEEDLFFSVNQGLKRLEISHSQAKDHLRRYPLYNQYPQIYQADLYFTSPPEQKILISLLYPPGRFILDGGIVPGSVSVYVNSRPESRFEVDYETGLLSMDRELKSQDQLRVVYRTEAFSFNGGDLLALQGNHFDFGEYLDLDLAAALRWNFLLDKYTTGPGEHQGDFTASGRLDFKRENLKSRLEGAFSIRKSDTTNYRRLYSAEEDFTELELGANIIFPSAPPLYLGPDYSDGLDHSQRGRLFYKDYRFFSSGSYIYQSWDWPNAQNYNYGEKGSTGPYLCADENSAKRLIALDFECEERGNWVGARVDLSQGSEEEDFSRFSEISFSLFTEQDLENARVFVQIGRLSEDLDDDGILDEENSIYSEGMNFNAAGLSSPLFVGKDYNYGANGRRDSEDFNGNGILDREEISQIYTAEITSWLSSSTAGWQQVSLPLTLADRARLSRTNAMRFIIVSQQDNLLSGRLLLQDISFTGSPVGLEITGNGNVILAEINEARARTAPSDGKNLQQAHDISRFLESQWDQKVLQCSWEDFSASGENFSLKSDFNTISLSEYKYLIFYLRKGNISGTDPSFLIHIQNREKEYLRFKIDASDLPASWTRVEINLKEAVISLDGLPAQGALVSRQSGIEEINRLKISLQDSSEGDFYLDEIHFQDAPFQPAGTLSAEISWKRDKALLKLGKMPLFSKTSLFYRFNWQSPDFASFKGESAQILPFFMKGEAASDLLILNLDLDGSLYFSGDDIHGSLSHIVTLPLQLDWLSLSDDFSTELSKEGNSYHHKQKLELKWPKILTFQIDNEGRILEKDNWQSCQAEINLADKIPWKTFLKADLSYTRLSSSPLDYGQAWIAFWQESFYKKSSLDRLRESQQEARIGWDNKNWHLLLKGESSLNYQNSSLSSQQNEARLELDFSINLPPKSKTPWILKASYSKQLNSDSSRSANLPWRENFKQFAEDLFYSQDLLLSAPYYEFFASSSQEKLLSLDKNWQDYHYSPGAKIGLFHTPASSWWYLLLPSLFQAEMQRDLKRQGNLPVLKQNFKFSYNAQAHNLFGSKGTYKVLPFYSTEQLANSIKLDLERDELEEDLRFLLSIGNEYSFWGQQKEKFTLKNELSIPLWQEKGISHLCDLELIWKRPLKKSFRIPYLDREVESYKAFWVHEESIKWNMDLSGEEQKDSRFSLVLGHETMLEWTEDSYLSLFLNIGWESHFFENAETSQTFAFETGLKLRAEF